MSAGGAYKSTTNETEKEAAPNVKEKLYSGVTHESVDDEKSNKLKYHLWKQKYVGDQIREPQPLPASKRPKVAEVPSGSALSTAFGYIISPVKYIASAFTYSASETDQPLEKLKGKSSKAKEQSPRQVVLSKQTAAVNSTITPQDPPQKISEPPVKALKTIPLSEITAANSMSAKSRGGTPAVKSKDKKTDLKQKPGSSKKVHEIKKSQSQQIKGSPKVFKSYSPPRNADALPVVSSTKLHSVNDMKIVQSNRSAFRVLSREDNNTNADMHAFRFETNPALASRSNNSNVMCELSPLMSPLKDELYFAADPLLTYPVENCSNSSLYNWNLAVSSRHKHAFHPDLTRRRGGSPLEHLPAASNVAQVLDISCDREAIETIFSGNLLTQCTPTQLLAGDKSQPGSSLLQESFIMDSAEFRETLLANDKIRPSTSPLNKWQPVKDFEREPNYIIVPVNPPLKKAAPLQSPKTSSKTKAKSQKTAKGKPPTWNKGKMSKQDSDPSSSRSKSAFLSSDPSSSRSKSAFLSSDPSSSRSKSAFLSSDPSSSRSKSAFLSSSSKLLSPRPSSLSSPSLKRAEVIVVAVPKKKEEINKEVTKKTSPATAALKTTTIAAATTAVSEAVIKAATSKVHPSEATTVAKTDDKSVKDTSSYATMRATEHSALPDNEETWLLHAIKSLSPKRKDSPHNSTSETHPPAPSTPTPQPSASIASGSPITPATASISSKSVTITSAAAATAEAEKGDTYGGASLAMRGALKFTSVVKEALKKSHSVNILGKKQLSTLTPRGEYDQEKEDFAKCFSVSATLHGEFP